MYTLKGIFPEPKKLHKKNFIKENMKQLKFIQSQSKTTKDPKFTLKTVHPPRLTNPLAAGTSVGTVKSSPSNRSGKATVNVSKVGPASRKKHDIRIKKGDMAEFLKRKEQRQALQREDSFEDDASKSSDSSSRLRDVACQTIESNLSQRLTDSAKVTTLYSKKEIEDNEAKIKASGDSGRHHPQEHQTPRRTGDELTESGRKSSRLNSILDRKDRDPYLPPGYQKGVIPKYLRERKEVEMRDIEGVKADDDQATCPPGHVTLPDNERKETLKMLRSSFAELVSELNKLPVKTDTLRMKNRKMELEKQLAKLEEGIKVFSRPKVFVKIGE